MKRNNRLIFRLVFLFFLLAVIWLLTDMARHTTAPWNKEKEMKRALEK